MKTQEEKEKSDKKMNIKRSNRDGRENVTERLLAWDVDDDVVNTKREYVI